jgi:hypothetical protein
MDCQNLFPIVQVYFEISPSVKQRQGMEESLHFFYRETQEELGATVEFLDHGWSSFSIELDFQKLRQL